MTRSVVVDSGYLGGQRGFVNGRRALIWAKTGSFYQALPREPWRGADCTDDRRGCVSRHGWVVGSGCEAPAHGHTAAGAGGCPLISRMQGRIQRDSRVKVAVWNRLGILVACGSLS